MTLQDLMAPVNADLSFALIATVAISFGVLGWTVGRVGMMRHAKSEVHDALDRACRDVRLYATNEQGNAVGAFAQRALREAEYIVGYRSSGNNYKLRPTGESRMRPGGVPRSHRYQQEQRVQEIREAIKFHSLNANQADDTYTGPIANVVHRRYSPNSQVLIKPRRGRR